MQKPARSIPARHVALITQLCRHIESAASEPSLGDLAALADMSPHHLQRLFKSVTGVTPKAYALAQRAKRVRAELTRGSGITEALYDAGYNTASRFYDEAPATLGMTPSVFRAGGTGTVIRFALGQCSLGDVLVAASERGICAILLGDDAATLLRELQDQFPKADLVGGDAVFERWMAEVVGFVEAPHQGLDLPLDIRGTAFQQRVWHALRQIPPGTTVSYAELARRLGQPAAVRAVAGACAANTLAVAIPCHRVVRTDGALSGYRWGVARKQALIDRETRQTEPQRRGDADPP